MKQEQLSETKITLGTEEVVPSSSPNIRLNSDHAHASNRNSDGVSKDQRLLYGIKDIPPWYMCIFLGFQVSGF